VEVDSAVDAVEDDVVGDNAEKEVKDESVGSFLTFFAGGVSADVGVVVPCCSY
jgi:hypothetical protein